MTPMLAAGGKRTICERTYQTSCRCKGAHAITHQRPSLDDAPPLPEAAAVALQVSSCAVVGIIAGICAFNEVVFSADTCAPSAPSSIGAPTKAQSMHKPPNPKANMCSRRKTCSHSVHNARLVKEFGLRIDEQSQCDTQMRGNAKV